MKAASLDDSRKGASQRNLSPGFIPATCSRKVFVTPRLSISVSSVSCPRDIVERLPLPLIDTASLMPVFWP